MDHEITEMQAIADLLTHANVPSFDDLGKQDGTIDFTCECVWSALNYMKSNPNASIQEACEIAYYEWIK